MIGASMAVLDTAAKNREELLYDRYRAGRDVIARFTKDPPYAYIIPREQRDTPTAATAGGEADDRRHRDAPGDARRARPAARRIKEGDWVILMDQPFAALVKELFDMQKYPQIPHPPAIGARPAAGGGRGAGGGGGRGGGGSGTGGSRRQRQHRQRRLPRRRRRRRVTWRRWRRQGRGGRRSWSGGRSGPAGGGQAPPATDALRRDRLDAADADGGRSGRGGAAGRATRRAATLRKIERVEPIAGQGGGHRPGVRFLAQHQCQR